MLRKKALNYTMRNNTLQVIPSLETRIRVLLHHMGPTHPEKHQSVKMVQKRAVPFVLNKRHSKTGGNQENITKIVRQLGWDTLHARRSYLTNLS
jgi:hypothetical protein